MTWQLWAALSAGFATLTAVWVKMSLEKLHPDHAMAMRSAVIAVFAVGFVAARTGWSGVREADARSLLLVLLAGAAACASLVCYFRALHTGPLSQVAAIDKLSVVLVVAVGVAYFREYPTPRQAVGLLLVLAGVVVLLFGKPDKPA
jgi:bacterial/archaeal transporter family protein